MIPIMKREAATLLQPPHKMGLPILRYTRKSRVSKMRRRTPQDDRIIAPSEMKPFRRAGLIITISSLTPPGETHLIYLLHREERAW